MRSREDRPAKLDWLYEFEQMLANQRRPENPSPTERAVDKLLAMSWP